LFLFELFFELLGLDFVFNVASSFFLVVEDQLIYMLDGLDPFSQASILVDHRLMQDGVAVIVLYVEDHLHVLYELIPLLVSLYFAKLLL